MNDPEAYSYLSSEFHDIEDLISEFPEGIKAMKGRILDIGCGPGNTIRKLLSHLPNDATVDGIDISAPSIKFAAECFKNESRLSFFQLDIQTSELPKNLVEKYDNAVSFYCLHWCYNLKQAIQNIYSVLRPGGKVFVTFITNIVLFDIYVEQHKNPKFSSYMKDVWNFIPSHYQRDDAEEMFKKDLKEAGFQVLYCSNKWKTFYSKNLESYANLLISVNPFMDRMPEDVREEYRNHLREEIITRYLNRKNSDRNDTPAKYEFLIMKALFQKPMPVDEC